MRRLGEEYTSYSDDVMLYVVGYDPTETLDSLELYKSQMQQSWTVASGDQRLFIDLDIRGQDSKLAFDSNGLIIYRQSYGQGDSSIYRLVLAELASSVR